MRGCATSGSSSSPGVPGRSRREFLAAAAVALTPPRATTFARTIAELSGPETGPPADNLVSNEDSYPRVAGELNRLAPERTVYLGVGPDQNFSLIAAARPASAFILDHRRRNVRLHLLHKGLMTLAEDRAGYLSTLTARAPSRTIGNDAPVAQLVEAFRSTAFDRARLDEAVGDVARVLKPVGVLADDEWPDLATIQARLAGPGVEARFLALRMYPTLARQVETTSRDGGPGHFLASEASYRLVRDLELRDRVIPIVGDFAGAESLTRLGGWLRREGQRIGVVYVSDVEFFLLRAGRFAAYIEGLARLPIAEGAVIVRTSTREIDHPERVAGDSSTTIVRSLGRFLEAAKAGRIRAVDDLFRQGR
jgi:hypothetical protein